MQAPKLPTSLVLCGAASVPRAALHRTYAKEVKLQVTKSAVLYMPVLPFANSDLIGGEIVSEGKPQSRVLANSNSTAVTGQPFLRADFFLPPTIWRSHKGAGNECPEQDGKICPSRNWVSNSCSPQLGAPQQSVTAEKGSN